MSCAEKFFFEDTDHDWPEKSVGLAIRFGGYARPARASHPRPACAGLGFNTPRLFGGCYVWDGQSFWLINDPMFGVANHYLECSSIATIQPLAFIVLAIDNDSISPSPFTERGLGERSDHTVNNHSQNNSC